MSGVSVWGDASVAGNTAVADTSKFYLDQNPYQNVSDQQRQVSICVVRNSQTFRLNRRIPHHARTAYDSRQKWVSRRSCQGLDLGFCFGMRKVLPPKSLYFKRRCFYSNAQISMWRHELPSLMLPSGLLEMVWLWYKVLVQICHTTNHVIRCVVCRHLTRYQETAWCTRI